MHYIIRLHGAIRQFSRRKHVLRRLFSPDDFSLNSEAKARCFTFQIKVFESSRRNISCHWRHEYSTSMTTIVAGDTVTLIKTV